MTPVDPDRAPRPITEAAAELGLDPTELIPYGFDKAKLPLSVLDRPARGRLVLVSAITPTPAGEGKTTTSIGLGDGLRHVGASVCLALREPSLGPCMGVKGGATGGGRASLTPRTDINLHFTGDFHAITAAHNLLAAMVDNHLHFGKSPVMDARRVVWRRTLDVNDRSLRQVVVGLGGSGEGVPRETGFDITAASEIMAILCLARDREDLRARLGRIVVGTTEGAPGERGVVTAADIGATGAMMALLKDALLPNLVQTLEGTPALVHGGPFANIAHGCNSVIATRAALRLADWVVTEAGFGFDLGGEKFFDLKCVSADLAPAAVVLVATIRALKMHGGVDLADLGRVDAEAVARGLPNLARHIESVGAFGRRPVVALNRFGTDDPSEIAVVRRACEAAGLAFAVSDPFASGGEGAVELARQVMAQAEASPTPVTPLYPADAPPVAKIRAVATRIYGAREVVVTKAAETALKRIDKMGLAHLPICIAKTQSSLSDDPKRVGRPEGFDLTVRDVQLAAGAGFLVILTGELTRMPGLPKRPQALDIDLVDERVVGLR